jgi:hypothetical protein
MKRRNFLKGLLLQSITAHENGPATSLSGGARPLGALGYGFRNGPGTGALYHPPRKGFPFEPHGRDEILVLHVQFLQGGPSI